VDFDIQPSILMKDRARSISLPHKLRRDVEVIVGQFLQLRGNTNVVLEVCEPLVVNQEFAFVSPCVFDKIQGKDIEFKVLDVTLGCDPEFFILWGSRHIIASNYLPFQGQIGADGGLGELRPMYGLHEDQVVDNLRSLISKVPRSLKRTQWLKGFPQDGNQFSYQAHSYFLGTAAGFHIHLGIPPEILNTSRNFNRSAINHIVRCLDWYVSVPLVPLEVAPQRRIGRSQYGQPGDYRPTNITLEYRTPGAFYLRSPKLARGLLGLSLMVTETIVSRMKVASNGFINLHKLTAADFHEIMPIPAPEKIKATLKHKNSEVALDELPWLYDQLMGLPTFAKHRGGLEAFFSAVRDKEQPGPNLLQNWKE
jgi:hypothetical protein